jgi:hypothetical protein
MLVSFLVVCHVVGSNICALHLTTTCSYFSTLSLCAYVLRHIYWRNAFPLYGRDYGSVLEAIEKMEKNLPGFFYAGKPPVFRSKQLL